jgi:MscS family membrane protein
MGVGRMAVVVGTVLIGAFSCLRGEIREAEDHQPPSLNAQTSLPGWHGAALQFTGRDEGEISGTGNFLPAPEDAAPHYGREVGQVPPGERDGTRAECGYCCRRPVPREQTWYSTTLDDIIAAGAVLILTATVYVVFIGRLFTALEKRFQRQPTHLLHALRRPVSCFVMLCGGVGMAQFLVVSPDVLTAIGRVFHSGTLFLATWMATCFVDALFDSLSHRTQAQNSEFYGILPLLKRVCHIGIGIVGTLLVIDGLGFSVNGVFATLGIGGALIALAAKDSVANIFGSLSIVLDRPFKVGDWIKVGDGSIEGDVEQIGLRSTRIRTHAKTLMTVPNTLLTNEVIDNWSRMFRRRVRQTLFVAPTASAEQLENFVAAVESVLRGDEDLFPEPRFCAICEFEPAAIQILVYYFTLCTDLEPHMRVRSRINGQILAAAQRLGLNLSTPFQIRGNWPESPDECDTADGTPTPGEKSPGM